MSDSLNLCERTSIILYKQWAIVAALLLSLFLSSCSLLRRQEDPATLRKQNDLISGELTLIRRLLDEGKAEKAWASMRGLYQKHPDKPDVLNLAGLIHLALDNQDQAISIFRKAYQLRPAPATGLNLSSAYIASGHYKKARQILARLIRAGQPYEFRERLWHNYALTWEKEKQYKKASKYYQKALKINPAYFLSLVRLATLAKIVGNKNMSLHLFEKASRSCKSCFEPVHEIASFYINEGKYSEAVRILRGYLKTEKNIPLAERQQAKNLLQLARLATRRQGREPSLKR
ncbi:MAG: tetratricopeptide repeat protein [Deltaproteobacteria bacterium]|nr:tetratricopeptide repeat protein [Deltaproteobacteria bacterium]